MADTVTVRGALPWYLTALLISQPLHFGDYGGGWMQFLWAMLEIATIIVPGSGLYLWLKRGNTVKSGALAAAEAVSVEQGEELALAGSGASK